MISQVIDPTKKKHRVNRPPVPFRCTCGMSDIIVLPRCQGIMQFTCDCGREWKLVFNKTGGNIFEMV